MENKLVIRFTMKDIVEALATKADDQIQRAFGKDDYKAEIIPDRAGIQLTIERVDK